MASKVEKLLEDISSLSLLEAAELKKMMEEKFGVTAASPVAFAAMAPGATPVAQAEEKDSFDVILSSSGDKKIDVLKVVREVTGLGLKEAKDLVDGAPKPLKNAVKKEDAESIKKKIEAAGGKVELK